MMKLVVFFATLFVVSAIAADNIWTYSSGTKLLDADPAYFYKLETKVFRDPQATPTTYIICIASLSEQQRLVHVEKRKFVVGLTGQEGPDQMSFNPPFNISQSYKDLDIVDGIDDCIFAVLSQSQYLTIGTLPPTSDTSDRIEVVSKDGQYYVFRATLAMLFLPYPLWSPVYGMSSTFSFETLALKSGEIYLAASSRPSDNVGISFVGTDGADDTYLGAYQGVVFPTLAAFNDSSVFLCAEHAVSGVPCMLYPTFPVTGELILANTAELTYTNPRLSSASDASNVMFLTTLVIDTAQTSQILQIDVLNVSKQVVYQTQLTRDFPYLFDTAAIDNYLFLTYADNTSLKMDVLYWGETAPSYPPQAAPPVSEPMVAPAVPAAEPSAPVDGVPVTVPAAITPVKAPTSDQAINGAPSAGLTNEDIGAVVGTTVGAALAAAAIVLAVLLTRRQRKKKARESSEDTPSNEQDSMSSKSSASSSPNVTPVHPSLTGVNQEPAPVDHYAGDPKALLVPKELALAPAEIEKRMKIPYKSLVFNFELGSGNFGKVFKGEWHGAEVAIKVSNQPTNTEEFLAEAKLTLGISPHPNVVQTCGVSLDGPNPCIVLGFCGGGSLDRYLHDKHNVVDNKKKRDYALRIAYGLLHLHQNNIVHRDLAARNILLANDGTPKISDFGMSRVITSATSVGKTKQTIGPLRWMAPENIAKQLYSAKSDVWSYGILVWEIVARKEPHLDDDQLLIGADIRDEGYHPEIPHDCEPALKRVMEMCWKKNPEDRPTMEEIIDVLRPN